MNAVARGGEYVVLLGSDPISEWVSERVTVKAIGPYEACIEARKVLAERIPEGREWVDGLFVLQVTKDGEVVLDIRDERFYPVKTYWVALVSFKQWEFLWVKAGSEDEAAERALWAVYARHGHKRPWFVYEVRPKQYEAVVKGTFAHDVLVYAEHEEEARYKALKWMHERLRERSLWNELGNFRVGELRPFLPHRYGGGLMHSKYKDDLGVCEEALRELGIAVPKGTYEVLLRSKKEGEKLWEIFTVDEEEAVKEAVRMMASAYEERPEEIEFVKVGRKECLKVVLG